MTFATGQANSQRACLNLVVPSAFPRATGCTSGISY